MAETWYAVTGTGAACGPGTRRPLSQTPGSSASTEDITSEHTWNRVETARTIAAGNWSVVADVTTGTGSGPANRVTCVVERRNSSCVVQQTIGSVQSGNLTAGSTQEVTFDFGSIGAVTFAADDILTVRFVRSNGGRTQVLRFNGASGGDADTRLIHPDIQATAALETVAFRGYDNDGTESTSTPKAAQNANFTTDTERPFLLRFEMQETSGVLSAVGTYQLQYNHNGAGWNNVVSGGTPVRVANGVLSDDANTSDQLTNGTGTFLVGRYDEGDGLTSSFGVSAGNHTEVLFAVRVLSNAVAHNDTVQFRVIHSAVTVTHTVIPTVTMNEVDAFDQVGFRFYQDDGGEAAATPIANENVDWSPAESALDTSFQLRIEFNNTGNTRNNYNWIWEYRKNAGTWTQITTTSNDIYLPTGNGHLVDAEDVFDRLTSGTGTFLIGEAYVAVATHSVNPAVPGHTECLAVLELKSADLSNNDTIDVRMVPSALGGSVVTLTQVPTMTITIAGSGITGNLSETLDNATLSATAEVAIDADLSKTLAAVTLDAAAAVDITADLSETLADVTSDGQADVAIDSGLSVTLATLTLDATGTVQAAGIDGNLSETLDAATLSATADVAVDATLSETLDAATLSGAATVAIDSNLSETLAALTLDSTATVAIDAALDTTLDAVALDGQADVAIDANLSETLGTLTLAATASVASGPVANLTVTLDNATLSASGTVDVDGTASITLGDVTLSSTADVDVVGSLSVTLGDVGLSASADVDIDATLDTTLGSITLDAAAIVAIDADLSVTLADVTLDATGSIQTNETTGNLSETLDNLALVATGAVDVTAILSVTLDDLTLVASTPSTSGQAIITAALLRGVIIEAQPKVDVIIEAQPKVAVLITGEKV